MTSPPGPRPRRRVLVLGAATAAALLALGVGVGALRGPSVRAPVPAESPSHTVRILAMNDLHGRLQPPPKGEAEIPGLPAPCGGAAYVATHLKRLRAEVPDSVFVHGGDLTGATPLESSLFHDEPTVAVAGALGLRINAVGNHELDHGVEELRRLQTLAPFTYVTANLTARQGPPLAPPFEIVDVAGESLAFVGLLLDDAATIVAPSVLGGFAVSPGAAAVNALIPELRARGARAIVVVAHQGGVPAPGTPYDGCGIDEAGPDDVARLARDLDPAVDVLVSGHTHKAYVCKLSGKVVTSASAYGRVVTALDLTFDRRSHALQGVSPRNVPVTRDVPADPGVDGLVSSFVAKAAPQAQAVVGHVAAELLSRAAPSGESPLGDVIADAMLAATQAPPASAVVAFMNPGGVRSSLSGPAAGAPTRAVTFADLFAVQPFGNRLVTVSLRGAQILALLEAQFANPGHVRILQPSRGFRYGYRVGGGGGDGASASPHVIPGSAELDGVPLRDESVYRVTVNDFLFGGGDGFRVLSEGTNPVFGPVDVDALRAYFTGFGEAAAPPSSGTPRVRLAPR